MKSYLQTLNAEQYEATVAIDGVNFILAGAGSGKTRVITARTAYMIDNGINPKEILLLTFTNKAAKEMKDRLVKNGANILGVILNKIDIDSSSSYGYGYYQYYGTEEKE